MSRAKKGDAVVVERKHSAHYADMKMKRWSEFKIAQAARVGRDGIVTHIAFPHDNYVLPAGGFDRVYTIGEAENQEGGRRLLRKVTSEQNSWPDVETMKKAITEAFLWDRVL